jgi:hypothetical protein
MIPPPAPASPQARRGFFFAPPEFYGPGFVHFWTPAAFGCVIERGAAAALRSLKLSLGPNDVSSCKRDNGRGIELSSGNDDITTASVLNPVGTSLPEKGHRIIIPGILELKFRGLLIAAPPLTGEYHYHSARPGRNYEYLAARHAPEHMDQLMEPDRWELPNSLGKLPAFRTVWWRDIC